MAIASQSVEAHPIEESLRALVGIEAARSGSNKGLHEKLLALEEKLATGQLHLAVLGQMKRGKSSFINALLGADVLPTGVLPVTAIITEIRYGSEPQATVMYTTGALRESVAIGTLADYITEVGNPGNTKQVASVEISYPSAFLESGIVLIDTPGIGSTHAHNTETTESYLEYVDAGIVVLSVDLPITEVESQFLRRIKGEIPKLFFIVNKTDIGTPDELSKITEFLKNELNRLQIPLLLDMNSGRIRYDYVERLQASMSQFEKNLCAAIMMVTETLKFVLHQPTNDTQQQAVVAVLDLVVNNCSQLL
jgi:ribosome biogenesis GTPase A